jgi:uncharacterized repeat protein (TIGR02543 family)
MNPLSGPLGAVFNKPDDPTWRGHTFTGWFSTGAKGDQAERVLFAWPYKLIGSVTMFAGWKDGENVQSACTLTFNSGGGSQVPSVPVHDSGTKVSKLADPTRDGYTFLGWFSDEEGGTLYPWPYTITGNVTMYAHWQASSETPPTQYTLTFNSNGGTAVAPVSANVNTALVNPADPTRDGYTFLGWFSEATGGTLYSWPYTITGNVTMYAHWWDDGETPPTRYTITFDSHGGSPVTDVTAYAGTLVTKPTDPARRGYTFKGWYNAAIEGTAYTTWPHTLNVSVTMHAQWTANTYTVAYKANGGSGTMESSSHTYDVEKTLTANSFTRTGHAFAGWNTEANGSGTSYTDGESVTNLTPTNGATVNLYAQWGNDVSIAVTIGGSGDILVSGADVTISRSGANNAPKSFTATATGGYTVVQWYLDYVPIGGTAQSFTIKAANFPNGNYQLTVRVTKNGKPDSADIRFTVTD